MCQGITGETPRIASAVQRSACGLSFNPGMRRVVTSTHTPARKNCSIEWRTGRRFPPATLW